MLIVINEKRFTKVERNEKACNENAERIWLNSLFFVHLYFLQSIMLIFNKIQNDVLRKTFSIFLSTCSETAKKTYQYINLKTVKS